MSKLFDQLKGLPKKPSIVAIGPADFKKETASELKTEPKSLAPKTGSFLIFFIVGIIIALGAGYLLGSVSSNIAAIKNKIFFNMEANIQQQQNQILLLNKKLDALQTSVNTRINNAEEASKDLNKSMVTKLSDLNDSLEDKFDDLNNSVKSKLDQSTINVNQMDTIMQGKIDEVASKLNKLQAALQASAIIPDQTNTVTTN